MMSGCSARTLKSPHGGTAEVTAQRSSQKGTVLRPGSMIDTRTVTPPLPAHFVANVLILKREKRENISVFIF